MSDKHEELSRERKQLQAEGRIPEWYSTQSWQMFKSKYLVPSEGDVKSRYMTIAETAAKHLKGARTREYYRKRFFELMWMGVLSPASPVLANMGTDRGMPVSCSGQYVGDSVDSFYTNLHETAMLSKNSFGTSGYFGDIRERDAPITGGGKANGARPVIEDYFTAAAKISHGGMRVGSFAAYVPMGSSAYDECVKSLHLDHKGKNYGWNITDEFTKALSAGDQEATQKFSESLYTKLLTGKGYYFFPDKANRHRPQMYKDLGLDIKASNLCTEIMLHSSEDLSFSCILSSLNLVHWDYIKNSDAVQVARVFLDCVCSEFLEISEGVRGLEKVREFTRLGRAVGLGTMGFGTLLQQERIPYDGLEAYFLNHDIWKHISEECTKASQWLAKELGEPEWCKGYGLRGTHDTAQAPTKSTAGLLGGVSESTFPDVGFAFTAGSVAGELFRVPPVFLQVLKDYGKYNHDVIKSIVEHNGSVQHLDFLSPTDKLVFRTAFEHDPMVNIRLATGRQKYLSQGQSLNFHIPDNDNTEELLSKVMTECVLNEDILSQYYVYTMSGVTISDECTACHA